MEPGCTHIVELLFWEKGMRSCSIVRVTFCRGFGVVEISFVCPCCKSCLIRAGEVLMKEGYKSGLIQSRFLVSINLDVCMA